MQDLAVCKGDDVILLGEGEYQGVLDLELKWSGPQWRRAVRVTQAQRTSSFLHPRFATFTP